MKPSKTKTILKQHIFIGNWDKSTVTNSCIDLSTNNESPNGKCYLMLFNKTSVFINTFTINA